MIRGVVAAALVSLLVLSARAAAAPQASLFSFVQLTEMGPGLDDDASVWVIRSDGTALRRLTAPCTDCVDAARFSPDGTTIAYHAIGRDYRSGIFVMRPNGSGKHRLCVCGGDGGVSWSPGGRRIASSALGITIFTRGVGARQVPGRVSHEEVYDLDWAPDGRWFTFADLSNIVWIVGADGRNLRPLVSDATQPRFSPGGRLVVFTPAHARGISAISPAGGGPQPYGGIRGSAVVGSFAWSADGAQFAYFGRFGIHIRTLADGHERQVSIPSGVCRGKNVCVGLDWQQ